MQELHETGDISSEPRYVPRCHQNGIQWQVRCVQKMRNALHTGNLLLLHKLYSVIEFRFSLHETYRIVYKFIVFVLMFVYTDNLRIHFSDMAYNGFPCRLQILGDRFDSLYKPIAFDTYIRWLLIPRAQAHSTPSILVNFLFNIFKIISVT